MQLLNPAPPPCNKVKFTLFASRKKFSNARLQLFLKPEPWQLSLNKTLCVLPGAGAGLGAPTCRGFTGLPQPFINSPTDLSKAEAGAALALGAAGPGLPSCTPDPSAVHLLPAPPSWSPREASAGPSLLFCGDLLCPAPGPAADLPEAPYSIHLLSIGFYLLSRGIQESRKHCWGHGDGVGRSDQSWAWGRA